MENNVVLCVGVILAYERSFLRLSGYHENRKECLNAGIDYEAVLKRQQAEQRAAQLAHERNAL
jgi:hypothetical protein